MDVYQLINWLKIKAVDNYDCKSAAEFVAKIQDELLDLVANATKAIEEKKDNPVPTEETTN